MCVPNLTTRDVTAMAVLGQHEQEHTEAEMPMAATYFFAVLAVAFLAAALMRVSRGGGISHPQTKIWLLVGAIFTAVSAWLWSRS